MRIAPYDDAGNRDPWTAPDREPYRGFVLVDDGRGSFVYLRGGPAAREILALLGIPADWSSAGGGYAVLRDEKPNVYGAAEILHLSVREIAVRRRDKRG